MADKAKIQHFMNSVDVHAYMSKKPKERRSQLKAFFRGDVSPHSPQQRFKSSLSQISKPVTSPKNTRNSQSALGLDNGNSQSKSRRLSIK